jgi:hypothetical protein
VFCFVPSDVGDSSWELLHHKCVWYENIIRQMLLRVNVPLERLKFVRGTSYQLKEQASDSRVLFFLF